MEHPGLGRCISAQGCPCHKSQGRIPTQYFLRSMSSWPRLQWAAKYRENINQVGSGPCLNDRRVCFPESHLGPGDLAASDLLHVLLLSHTGMMFTEKKACATGSPSAASGKAPNLLLKGAQPLALTAFIPSTEREYLGICGTILTVTSLGY